MTEMKINIKNVYELTPLQEGMVFNHFIDAKSKAYMEQVELNLEGHLDISHFESSFQELVNRHDVFRTIFRYSKLKKPLQVVFKERKSSFSFDNLSTLGASEKERIIGEYKHKDLERNFNLEKDSLIRVKVFKQTSKLYTVFVSFHHIILDGWGLGVALKEWLEIYASKINKQPMKVINGFPYSDYIVWLRNQNLEEASRFWEKTLQGYNNKAGIMPALKKKDGKSNYLHLEHFETFDVPLTKALVSLAKLHKVTLNSVLRAIWGMLLQKYNDSNDVVFGSVVSGRPPELSGVEKAVGLFINTIPVRIKGSSGQTFPELLQQVHGDIQAENKYHYYPLYESLAKSELKNELIDHVIAFENYPLDRQSISEGQDIGFSINELKIFEETNFDFNMNIFPGEKITLKITYNGHVYQKQYIEQICHHFKNLVCCILDSPNKLLSEYEILTEDELSEVLQNKVNVKYPDDKTIHELFKMQAEFNPNKKAAVFGDKHLTYKELNSRADALAFLLRKKGVRRQEPVGLISDRSLDTVVGMLAILKSGGCYVPIDPTLPAKRISYILKDCSARFLLTPKVWKLPCKFSGEVIELKDELYKTEFPLLSNENICSPGDLAYIIYTSGTTGKPKGVMVEHRNVVSLILNDKLPFSFNSKDVWTIFHSFSFDFSVWELYGSLLNGGTCVIVPKDTAQDPKAFLKLLQKENVTVLNQTPSAFSHLIEEISTGGADNLSLRYVVFGGEALKPAMLHQLKCSYPHLHLINMYGITETTVHVTYKEITLNEIEANLSSIGRPLPTLTAYVMNKDQNLVPVGSIGELYIGGEGVSKGYINNEALTKERFIVNPYDSSELIYRSGDIVRRMLNGELEYLGRIDHQIKIRGHRIEMGEIENRLLFHPLINEAAVLAYKDQTDANYLCAYVASAEDLSSADLRKYLAEFLPDYMVPAHFIFLSSLPLTSNGKIDRNALPQPEMRSVSPFVEPQSDMERRLAPVWREVLGLERVGIHDDFFEMGGHSLRAAQLVNMIHKNLDMELPLKAVFEYPTIHLMARGIEQENKEDKQGFNEIQPVAEQEHYPASSAQKRMLILNQLEDIGTNYNITGAVQLNGALDPIRLEEAIRQVISRHEALRTSFSRSEDGFIQRVHPQVSFSLESWEKEEPMVPQRVNDFSRPFDLSSAPLLRAGLISMGTEKHVMVLDMHHIISDASSLNTILEEISLFYKGETLPPLRLQYKDVSAWQSERMEADSFRKAEDFWLKELAGDLPVFDLLRKERPRFQSFEGERVDFTVPKSLAAQLQGLAHKTGTTLFMVLLSAYQVLLSRYSGQEDILVGTPAAGRTHADLHRMVGMLGNTLPMRTRVREDLSFRALLENVRDRAIRAFEHQTYPFDQMVEKVSVKRDMSRNPIFDCMFIMHDADAAKLDLENLQVIPYPVEDRSAKVDLALEVTEKDRELETWFQYSTALFSRHEIETMAAHFLRILKEIAEDPDQPLSAVEMISDYERHNLLHRLNPTEIQGEERPIHELFEAQAALTPGRTAIVSKGKEFTYREINEQANRMARALQRKKVKKGDRIGVMVRRSESLMTALLAVLKTGAAYVPIDPEYPEERIAFMAEDSGVKYVIADEAGCFQSFKEKVLPLSELAGTGESPSNPEAGVSADDLAYIIYTSGSTGNPKGVMVEHRSVQNLIEGMSDCVGVSPDDAVLALTTVSFDIFVTETFLPLAKGACVIMASEAEHQDPGLLSRLILDRKVSILQATPSRIKGLVMHPDGEKCLKMVKVLIMGGEALPPSLLHSLQAHTHLDIYNAYGPTETTIYSVIKNVTSDQEVTIGRPIRNTRCYIVGTNDRLQPMGVYGELCIAGSGVSRGYLNQPELTAEKFVKSPFEPGDIMYRTGDLARWLPDGQIEYAGRMDQQVKLRGYRIELKEIESHLEKMEPVREAAAAMHKDSSGDAYLCGYLVWKDGEKALPLEIVKAELAGKLPGYMVPAHFVVLEELPLTANGKLDRKALPEPERRAAGYEAPETGTEKQLAQIWSEVLGVQGFGIDDNFFDLGGHSLKATILAGKVKRTLKKELPLSAVFEFPTIRELSARLNNLDSILVQDIQPASSRKAYPLSSSQRRLFVLSQFPEIGTSYNMPSAWVIKGDLNSEKLQAALELVAARHEILRTVFKMVDGKPVQQIQETVEVKIECRYSTEKGLTKAIDRFVRPFDLEESPLFRTGLIKIENDQHLLLFDMHHILSDGTSIQILVKEVMDAFNGHSPQRDGIQYKDYAVWQQAQKGSSFYLMDQTFWMQKFKENIPVLELFSDHKRNGNPPNYYGSQLTFEINKELIGKLTKLAIKTNSSMFMIFMAAYNILLSRFSGQDDIVVGTPVAGRSRDEIQDTIGVFVNMLPMRNQPTGTKSFRTFLQEVRSRTLQALEHQDYPFEDLVEDLGIPRDAGRNPLFEAVLVHQNMDQSVLSFGDSAAYPYDLPHRTAKFDLTLEILDQPEGSLMRWEYRTSLFASETVRRMADHFLHILKEATEEPDQKLSALSLPKEERDVQAAFNDSKGEYDLDKTIIELFEDQASQTPENTAVVFGDEKWSYKRLNREANRLARHLQAKGAGAEKIVAVLADQSADMILAVLAVLKAGSAYVPIDPAYPAERIQYMLQDSQAVLAITQQHLTGKVKGSAEQVVLEERGWTGETEENLPQSTAANQLAYVIYTSGTTGYPKGVMVEHRSLSNLCQWHNDQFEVTEKDRSTKLAGFGFDASVWEIFPPLLKGASLYIVPEELRMDIQGINEFFEQNRITISFLPTPLCEPFLALDNQSLRVLLTGGDRLKSYRPSRFQLVNNYGPTENTVVATSGIIGEQKANLPIGYPIANTRVYILGKNSQLQPIGVPGELCIAGESLARGYLNRPELTREKFIDHPCEPGNRLYRTGDLARWLPDGRLEYLGRMDDQVKIRGHRIELGEIEAHLLHLEGVKDALVLAQKDADGQDFLCGYLAGGKALTVSAIRSHLSRNLPDYMIPASYVQLDQFPLTVNGKVDKQALPAPVGHMDTGAVYEAPQGDAEERLALVWKEVLRARTIGRYDHFFDLGGDSIKGIQVAARLHERGWKLELKDLFRHPTISELAPYMKKAGGVQSSQEEATGEVILTPIQRWFFDQKFKEAHHWNQSVLLYSPEGFDPEALESSVHALLCHHDALRMAYREEDGMVIQWNRSAEEGALYLWETIRMEETGDELAGRIEQESSRLQAGLNLVDGPLVAGALFQTRQGDHFLLAIHHLAVDGVSWRILLEDLAEGYSQARRSEAIQLPKKTSSFQQWSRELAQYAQSRRVRKEQAYWSEVAKVPVLPLPKDGEAPGNHMADESHVVIQFTKEETDRLLKEASRVYRTDMNDLLLTALLNAAEEWTGNPGLVIDLEGHGRESIGESVDISRTVGWFTTMFPVALSASGAADPGEQIQMVKEQLRRIPNKGMGYGLLAYQNSPDEKPAEYKPEVGFNYLGDFGESAGGEQEWRMSPYSSGVSLGPANHRIHALEINGMKFEGKLQFRLSYNRFEYRERSIRAFAESFKRHLKELADYCIAQERSLKTPSDAGYPGLSLEAWKEIQKVYPAELIEAIRPLSPMQEGILFEGLMNPDSPAYFGQLSFVAKGELESVWLRESFQDLAVRHEILRTVFTNEGDQPLQLVLKELPLEVKEVSLLDIDKEDQQEAIDAWKAADIEAGFDLKKGPLMRLQVLQTGEEEFVLIWSHHHILMDGWCLSLLLQEFLSLYAGKRKGLPAELGSVPSYGRYIEWLADQDPDQAKGYWREHLKGYAEKAALPKKQAAVSVPYQQGEVQYSLPASQTRRLEEVARELNSTVSTVLQAAWGVLLSQYSQQDDAVFGTVVSGRPPAVKGVETIVGLFINAIPVRYQPSPDKTFAELVKEGQSAAVSSQENSFLSLADIQGESELGQGLIDHLFVVENYPFDEEAMAKGGAQAGFSIQNEGVFEQTSYDLNVIVVPGEETKFSFRFNTKAYNVLGVNSIKGQFQTLLNNILENPKRKISSLDILSVSEMSIISKFNSVYQIEEKNVQFIK